MIEILKFFACGALGSLVKDILEDGKIVLPRKKGAEIILGSIGGMIIGGFIGYVIDGRPISASLGGYVGHSILKNLVLQQFPDVDVK